MKLIIFLFKVQRDQSSESDSDELIACSKQPEADDEFKGFFNKLAAAVQDITSSSDESLLDGLIQEISTLRKKLECTLDQYGRTVLHEVVEKQNHALANILISSGINPNSKEGCGQGSITYFCAWDRKFFLKMCLQNVCMQNVKSRREPSAVSY